MSTAKRTKKTEKKPKKQDQSQHVHQNSKISFDLNIRESPWTERQKEIIDAVLTKKS